MVPNKKSMLFCNRYFLSFRHFYNFCHGLVFAISLYISLFLSLSLMAATASLPIAHSFHSRKHYCSTQEALLTRSKNCPRLLILLTTVSCHQSRLQIDPPSSEPQKRGKEEDKKKQIVAPQPHQLFISSIESFGKRLKDNLSPKQKGDWKDLMLMSLSFAVYVYMSQKIVCAYCAWMSMPKQPW